jgi:hypothetical protein
MAIMAFEVVVDILSIAPSSFAKLGKTWISWENLDLLQLLGF